MNVLLKNWLCLNSNSGAIKYLAFFVITLLQVSIKGQIANYVNNGGFEEKYSCNILGNVSLSNAKYWDEIDADQACRYCNFCYPSVPYNGFGFQYPRTDSAYVISDFFILNDQGLAPRTYFRNHLKTNLAVGKTYCVKFFVNNGNNSTCGMDGFGAYFGDNSLDTINYGHLRLTYLQPQIKNPNNNIISDTLNWIPITGTFVANGTEKYMVIGNFKTDAATNYTMLAATTGFTFSEIGVDDVSCIPIDLPAFAGPDKSCVVGDSVFIGRQPDVGIDEDCMWYKLPVIITPTTAAIDTVAGLWVKPVVTTTYVVRQEICGIVKFDTVVVYKDYLGLSESKWRGEKIDIFPNPASEKITIKGKFESEQLVIKITDVTGRCVLEREFQAEADQITLEVELQNGIYFLYMENKENNRVIKKIIISK